MVAVHITPSSYRAIAKKQRARLRSIARKIGAGKQLSEWEMGAAKDRLELAADLITDAPVKNLYLPEKSVGELLKSWLSIAVCNIKWDHVQVNSDDRLTEIRMVAYSSLRKS